MVEAVNRSFPYLVARTSPRAERLQNVVLLRRLAGTLVAPLLLLLLALPTAVFAHQLDEYLQATLVVIEPDRVRLQINLTPGVAVAGQVLALIDRDDDGVISTNEAGAYAEKLKRDLELRLDERNLELELTASYFPGTAELRSGWGFIQMEFSARPGRFAAGAHKLTLENRHLTGASVYLFNAAQPASGSIRISKQIRDENQSAGGIEFVFQRPQNSSRAMIGLIALLLVLVVSVSAGARRKREGARLALAKRGDF